MRFDNLYTVRPGCNALLFSATLLITKMWLLLLLLCYFVYCYKWSSWNAFSIYHLAYHHKWLCYTMFATLITTISDLFIMSFYYLATLLIATNDLMIPLYFLLLSLACTTHAIFITSIHYFVTLLITTFNLFSCNTIMLCHYVYPHKWPCLNVLILDWHLVYCHKVLPNHYILCKYIFWKIKNQTDSIPSF